MAKQKSIIKLQGSLDDITFYQMNGGNFAKRKSPGLSKERINSDPAFKRTKENNQEFAGAMAAAGALRKGFVEIPDLIDRSWIQRFLKLCRELISDSPGIRGQRPFLPAAHKDRFLSLVLQKKISFESIFQAPFSVAAPASRNEATITIPDFNAGNMISPPQGATHFRMINHVSVLSAFEYDVTLLKYQPTEPSFNSMHNMEGSNYFPVNGMTGATITLRGLLYDVEELPEDAVLLVCLGIQFYQLVGGTYYELASSDALKVVKVV